VWLTLSCRETQPTPRGSFAIREVVGELVTPVFGTLTVGSAVEPPPGPVIDTASR
jgi:hypothetical protein